MAVTAAENALNNSVVPADSIDMVLVATCTSIDSTPNMAARVAAHLGLRAPTVIDINAACSGFCHALAIADHSIRAEATGHALVIGAENSAKSLTGKIARLAFYLAMVQALLW